MVSIFNTLTSLKTTEGIIFLDKILASFDKLLFIYREQFLYQPVSLWSELNIYQRQLYEKIASAENELISSKDEELNIIDKYPAI